MEEGRASGSQAGTVKAWFTVGPTITGTVTLYVRGGSITVRGFGHLRNAHGGTYESFAGEITVTSGTGKYRHAHGHSGFYGTVDRRNDSIQVQTRGRLSY